MDKEQLQQLLIAPHASIKDAMRRLNDTGGRILFVIGKAKQLLGTVTDGDIRRGIVEGVELNHLVAEIMNRHFLFISQSVDDVVREAKALMRTHSISQIPILDSNRVVRDVIFMDDYLVDESAPRGAPRFDTPVVIMAGGKGTRLDPFTTILPKPLIPFRNKPIVEHIMDRYFECGFYKFTLIINYKKEMIKIYFSEMKHPYEVTFKEEDEYYGTAGGLGLLKGHFTETFFVTNCDTILDGDYLDMMRLHRSKSRLITIIGSHKAVKMPYGVLKMRNGNFSGLEEKPEFDMFINTGTYVLEPAVLDALGEKESIDMDKFIARVYAQYPNGVGVYPHWKNWFDIGQWSEYQESLKKFENFYGA